jgi:hypothetical protein
MYTTHLVEAVDLAGLGIIVHHVGSVVALHWEDMRGKAGWKAVSGDGVTHWHGTAGGWVERSRCGRLRLRHGRGRLVRGRLGLSACSGGRSWLAVAATGDSSGLSAALDALVAVLVMGLEVLVEGAVLLRDVVLKVELDKLLGKVLKGILVEVVLMGLRHAGQTKIY